MADHNLYTGLSEKSRMWIIGLSAFVATVNLCLAWSFAYKTEEAFSIKAADMAPYKEAIRDGGARFDAPILHDLTARSMHIVALSKIGANKHSLVLAAFGAAFALSSIGFALFILGADGAFKVAAATPDKTRITIAGTAPGLLCFLIAGALVALGIWHRSELNMPPMPSMAAPAVEAAPVAAPCKHMFRGQCLPDPPASAADPAPSGRQSQAPPGLTFPDGSKTK